MIRFVHTQNPPRNGEGDHAAVEGAHGEVSSGVERWDPSARSSGHLPVPGRIYP